MNCPQCGQLLDQNTKFCPNCGSQITTVNPINETTNQIPVQPTNITENINMESNNQINASAPVFEQPVNQPVTNNIQPPTQTVVQPIDNSMNMQQPVNNQPPLNNKINKTIPIWVYIATGVGALLLFAVIIILLTGNSNSGSDNNLIDNANRKISSNNNANWLKNISYTEHKYKRYDGDAMLVIFTNKNNKAGKFKVVFNLYDSQNNLIDTQDGELYVSAQGKTVGEVPLAKDYQRFEVKTSLSESDVIIQDYTNKVKATSFLAAEKVTYTLNNTSDKKLNYQGTLILYKNNQIIDANSIYEDIAPNESVSESEYYPTDANFNIIKPDRVEIIGAAAYSEYEN